MITLVDWGYVGLFVAAFLAATILPLSSKIVLSGLLLQDLSPIWLVLIATIGNVLGAVVNYALGYCQSSGLTKVVWCFTKRYCIR